MLLFSMECLQPRINIVYMNYVNNNSEQVESVEQPSESDEDMDEEEDPLQSVVIAQRVNRA